jgi:hypothetical protein
MGVGDHDCRRIDPFLMVEPIRPTIDHYAHTAQPHQQGAVAKVAARPDLDLAAGTEKGELDAALLTPFDRDPLLVFLRLCTLRQSYREHAVSRMASILLASIHVFQDRKAPLEGTITALGDLLLLGFRKTS